MSDRRSEFQNENPNPSEKFLQWESNHQKLSYWDKASEAKKLIELPFKFLTLKTMHTVKGYSDQLGGIYSNEVERLGEDELFVKYFKGNQEIAKGKWNDIKDTVERSDGRYHISIYAMTEKGSLINISFKGAAVGAWFEFTKKTRNRLPDEWVSIPGFKEGKQGAVTFYFPVFEYAGSLDKETGLMADEKYNEVKAYLDKYLQAPIDSNEASQEAKSDEMDIIVNGEKVTETPDDLDWLSNGGDPI